MCWFKILDVTNQCFVEKKQFHNGMLNSKKSCTTSNILIQSLFIIQQDGKGWCFKYCFLAPQIFLSQMQVLLKCHKNWSSHQLSRHSFSAKFQRRYKFLVAIGNLVSHITVDTLVSYLRSLLCLWFLNRLSLTIPAFNVCIFAPNRPFAPEISQVLGIRNVFKKKKRIIDKLWFHCLSVGIVY